MSESGDTEGCVRNKHRIAVLDERLRAVETIATELLGKYQTLIEGINDANTKYQTILDRMDKYAKGK